MQITKSNIADAEIAELTLAIANSPDIIYVSSKIWKSYQEVYVSRVNDQLVGCCALKRRGDWLKLGPLVILDKFQGQGYGKKLIEEIVSKEKSDLFCTSSNIAVQSILNKSGFQEVRFWRLKPDIISLLIDELVKYFSLMLLKETISKYQRFGRRERRKCFIREVDSTRLVCFYNSLV